MPILSQNLPLIKTSKISPSSLSEVPDAGQAVSSEIPNEGFDSFPAVPDATDEAYGALSPCIQTIFSNADEQLTKEPYGALSQSVQTRLSNLNINKQLTEKSSDALFHPHSIPYLTISNSNNRRRILMIKEHHYHPLLQMHQK